MLPQNSWFRSAASRAGNADVVPSNGMVLGARLHQKAGLVQLRLREDGEVDGLRVDHSLRSEVVGGVAGVEACISAVKRSIGSTTGCTITEKAPTRAFSWLKAPTSTFTFKTLLRHYAKRAMTPR